MNLRSIQFNNPRYVKFKFRNFNYSITNFLSNKKERIKLYSVGILFTVFFPYVPSLIPTSDTQPFLILITFFIIIDHLLNRKVANRFFHVNNQILFFLTTISFVIAFSVSVNFLLSNGIRVTKVLAFGQFLIACLLGFSSFIKFSRENIIRVIIIYAVFTLVYFLTNGIVEELLIRSRAEDSEFLTRTGRGARTLSVEPSAFATQILNILVLYILSAAKGQSFNQLFSLRLICIISICLIGSFSGYGFVIFAVLMLFRFPKLAMLSSIPLVIVFRLLVDHIALFGRIRFLQLFELVINRGLTSIIKTGALGGRFDSFFQSFVIFFENFLWGDGFTNRLMGGLAGIPAATGIIGFLVLIVIFAKILILNNLSLRFKLFLLFWFLVTLLSGNIAIPIVGLIIGFILKRRAQINFTI